MGVIGDAVPGCRFQYLKPRIMAFDENAIRIFALHKCGRILVNLKPGSGCRFSEKAVLNKTRTRSDSATLDRT
jgi:hypothetical protein